MRRRRLASLPALAAAWAQLAAPLPFVPAGSPSPRGALRSSQPPRRRCSLAVGLAAAGGGPRGQRGRRSASAALGSAASAALSAARVAIIWLAGAVAAYWYVRRRFYEAGHVKKFITENTSIKIIDNCADVEDPSLEGQGAKGVYWYIKSDYVIRRMLCPGGNIALGETFMDGLWGSNDLKALLIEFIKLERMRGQLGWRATPFLLIELVEELKAAILPSNTLDESVSASRKNIKYHYDIDFDMLVRQLGRSMQYTCAYFHELGMTLDEAQFAKMRLVAKKLALKPGMRVIDLGCGYGALAYLIATEYGVQVTGVTLSEDQVAYAKQHYSHPNVDIRLQDYRTVEGQFDRVYSVGLMEHIGRKNYEAFFCKCYDLLKPDGIMLIHTLGWGKTGPWNPNTFMFRYIWPGAEMPHASAFTQPYTDRWHLEDWQSLGLSYSPTAVAWYENLVGTPEFERKDKRFQRMWKYYLLSGAASVESRKCSVWQVMFTKSLSARADDCHHVRAGTQEEKPAQFLDAEI